MIGPKDVAAFFLDRGSRAMSKAAGVVLRDPRGQEAVARAVGAAQRGRRRFEAVQERLLHAMGLPARPDYEEVAKRMARLKRKLRDLAKRIDEEGGSR